MLVFRTSISYHRFYEGKKYLGELNDSLRNANLGFCSFMRPAGRGLHSFPFQLNLSSTVHRKPKFNS